MGTKVNWRYPSRRRGMEKGRGGERGLNLGTVKGKASGPLWCCCDVMLVTQGASTSKRDRGQPQSLTAVGGRGSRRSSASPGGLVGSHPGVLGIGVSAQEILRKESSRSFFSGHWGQLTWASIPLSDPPTPASTSSQLPKPETRLISPNARRKLYWLLLTGTGAQGWGPQWGRSPLSLQGENGRDPPAPQAMHDGY